MNMMMMILRHTGNGYGSGGVSRRLGVFNQLLFLPQLKVLLGGHGANTRVSVEKVLSSIRTVLNALERLIVSDMLLILSMRKKY